MNKIYCNIQDKQRFIHDVTHHKNINYSIQFIKKYHKYEPYVDFLPVVLKNIIFEYINDIITLQILKYMGTSLIFHTYYSIYGTSIINYKPVRFDFLIGIYGNIDYMFINGVQIPNIDSMYPYKKYNMSQYDFRHNTVCMQKIMSYVKK